MKACLSEKTLLDLIDGEQPSDLSLRAKEHLKLCDDCRLRYNELSDIRSLLIHRRRPQVPKKVLHAYRLSLKQEFMAETLWTRFRNGIESIYDLFFDSRPIGVRLVKAAALIIIGIFIGKLVFQPISQQDSSGEKPNILMLTLSPTDARFIADYLTQSEIWLLAVVNVPSRENIQKEDLLFNKEIAQRLLLKTSLMEERKQQIDSELFTKFLNRFELLLLEMTNASDERIIDISSEIRTMIENSTLLHETKQLRERFEIVSTGA